MECSLEYSVVNGWGYEWFMWINKYMEFFEIIMTTTTSGKEDAILVFGAGFWRTICIYINPSKLLII